MPKLSSQFAKHAPNACLQLMPLDSQDHLQSLERFNTDLIMFLSVPIPGWMRAKEVLTSHFKIIAARQNAYLRQAGIQPGQRISMEVYCASRHALYSPSGDKTTWVDHALSRTGHRRHISQTTSTFQGLSRIVAVSDLLATVPALSADDARQHYDVDIYDHPLTDAASKIMMAWHYRNHHKHEHIWFRALVEQALNDLSHSNAPH